MNIQKLLFPVASKQKAIFTVQPHGDRWVVVRNLPNVSPTVVEDLRTEEFARRCAEAYNARGFQ